ncbi:hypothetical protein CRYUN_Cryun27aG0023800 [Craigia yunnanensis]
MRNDADQQAELPRWIPPDTNFLKMNVDVSYSAGNKEARLGMVVRDNTGVILLYVMTKVAGMESHLHAELKAIPFGFEMAFNNPLLSLGIDSDSLLAIQEIKKQNENFFVWECIISDIIGLAMECSSCSFNHVRRSANGLAHSLS